MIVKVLNTDNLSCVLLKNENIDEIKFSRSLYIESLRGCQEKYSNRELKEIDEDSLMAEASITYLRSLTFSVGMCNGVCDVNEATRGCILAINEYFDRVVDYIVTDQFAIVILNNMHFKINVCSLYQFLCEIPDDTFGPFMYMDCSLSDFFMGMTLFIRNYATKNKIRSSVVSIDKVSNEELHSDLINIFFKSDEHEKYLQKMKQYVEPSKFSIKFATNKDLMRYCNTQDLSNILECKNKRIVQKYEDYSQLITASDFGKVGVI